ncbi:MFS general substrate transporter [Viridothelium virens]|uniref:MFS general substrate transporter n=1 Tax=Viridothelium virens TaxID=1048519 RepID=A0A6A6H5G4_VIRVR|nr:MFS general substrate transporter [Viridothelium virens]
MEGTDLKDGSVEPSADVTVPEEPGRSRASVEYDDLEGLSLYEKKCTLINREIDSHGMGRYQWYIWSLCGFGYMLDLLWAQAFGLVLGPLQQELGFGNAESGNISTSFNSGLTAGAFVWGVLVDIIGRQWAFNLTVLVSSAFGIGLGGSNTYNTFLVLTAFVGFGVGGNIPIDTTITLEFIPQNRRFLLALLSIFQPIGVVICSAIAYGFIPTNSCHPDFSQGDALPSCKTHAPPCCSKQDNMGWRYLLYTLGAITLFVFILRTVIFRFKESPKFLVYRGRDDKAVEVLQYIARFNGRESDITLETLEALTEEHNSMGSGEPMLGGGAKQLKTTWIEKVGLEFDRYKMLFSDWQVTRLTILVWLTYIMDYWGFTVAGFYLPKILALKNSSLDLSLKFTYRSYIYIYFPGVVGVMLGAVLYQIPNVGRKWTMVISSGLMGASIFIFSAINDEKSNIGLNVMEYFFQSMFNAVLYGWTPEAFPAPIRGTACGVASFWGRLFGIVSPLIAAHLYGSGGNVDSVLYLAGGVTLGCVVSIALLPNKALGSQSF